MTTAPRVCAICGNPGTVRWTVGVGSRATFVSLCPTDAEPLKLVLEAGERVAAGAEAPAPGAPELPRKQPRKNIFEPLDWTPPS